MIRAVVAPPKQRLPAVDIRKGPFTPPLTNLLESPDLLGHITIFLPCAGFLGVLLSVYSVVNVAAFFHL